MLHYLNAFVPLRYQVADAQNLIAKHAIEKEFQWLLFLEHDVLIPPDCFVRFNDYMRNPRVPIVSGLYYTRSRPAEPLIFRGRGTSYYDKWKMGDLVWCDGIPTGIMLIHVGILKAMSLGAVVLTEWMTEEGMAEDMTEVDWLNQDMQTVEPEVVQHQQDVAQKFLMTKTKAELYDRCVRDKIPFAPISDPRDIATNRQLEARNFFVQIEHPELGDPLTYCGPFVQFSESPMKRWFQAPRIGEHNSEIYEKELGLSSEQMVMLKRARVI